MAELIFFIASIGAIAGAVAVVVLNNPFYSVLALVCHLLSLAGLFLLLRAEFLAAAQVVVYAGAVMVLYVFVVSYIGGAEQSLGNSPSGSLRILAPLFAGALCIELLIAVFGSGLKLLGSNGAGYQAGFGSPEQIGELLLTKFLLPFEAASLLLLIAAVGAVTLARPRDGDEISPDAGTKLLDEAFKRGPGSMSEGVE